MAGRLETEEGFDHRGTGECQSSPLIGGNSHQCHEAAANICTVYMHVSLRDLLIGMGPLPESIIRPPDSYCTCGCML